MGQSQIRIANMECITDFYGDNLVSGLTQNDFTVAIYDPNSSNRVDGTNAVTWAIAERQVGSGYYVLTFTPDIEGNWVASVIHPTYFPWGKSAGYKVISSVSNDDLLVFILGLY
jgi:hypothetical protein